MKVLILGGTAEASALAHTLAAHDIPAVFSYAGRVATPKAQPIPTRIGGFGGVDGLISYLFACGITHIVDATHPFAGQMSRNAVLAAKSTGIPLIALTRPPWQPVEGDRWHHVRDIDAAVDAVAGEPRRILLAIGRMHLEAFRDQPQHHYLLRLVDTPENPMPLPDCTVTIDRGPFTVEGDLHLLRKHRIDLVVSKNAGGQGAAAKITAARQLGLPVLMIDRPALPERREVHDSDAVLDWLHHGADLGV
ncbi:cobalt-precorrin-6A reductase [Marinobacter nanhaiticus D15-8W]|uniref:Cobalt-precorrin-6A reductase n=1 Tax=Marinobacter nanhaiticus D15-8W TaxID=626887 RepID=N6VVD7_9GAMM|nr:cobalt-precorrin-6A reductase [Marinobacter nanhaiticus]ENO14155.1 cobalt-precorrin-6A reductase [Marinobacter nanhaiticus D15-8W]